MKFTEYLFEQNKELWEEYLVHPFIKEIGEGTLPKEKFLNYLIQDYLYLKEYAKVFCLGVIKAETMDDMKFFYKSVAGTMEDETATHILYMNELGVTQKEAEAKPFKMNATSYASYMQSIATKGGIREIAIATLPCTWSYSYIGKYLKKHYKDNLGDNYYARWIEMYGSKEFEEFAEKWIEYTDELCKNISENEKKKLLDIFTKSSIYEMGFWDMAYEELLEKESVI